VAIPGSEEFWPGSKSERVLPEFSPFQDAAQTITVFNRGQTAFTFKADTDAPWLTVTPAGGTVEKETQVTVRVDWGRAPVGTHRVPIVISGPNQSRVQLTAPVHNPAEPRRDDVEGFVEGDGCVSMESEHYSRAVNSESIRWQRIPDFGRTLSGMTPFPVTASKQDPGGNSPRLEYRLHLFHSGPVKVRAYCSPTLDFRDPESLCLAISFDDETPRLVNLWADVSKDAWGQAVGDNIKCAVSEHAIAAPGPHVLKFWMVDPGVVLQKIVVDLGGARPSYLGPPESFFRPVSKG